MTASTIERAPVAGERAPDFSLRSTSGATVSLAGFAGEKHVLLAFFPAAFTSVCTTELCAFSEDFDRFAGHGVEVLPISVDSVDALAEFKRKYDMKVDLLSDFKREASRAYGVLWKDAFLANRAYFLVDRGGVVRWAHVEAHPGLRRENHEILEQIAKLA